VSARPRGRWRTSYILASFAGIWTRWKSVRKVKEGETENDLFAFLTTEPNAVVAPIHPKAMPVILRTRHEIETWLASPSKEALTLQERGWPGGRVGTHPNLPVSDRNLPLAALRDRLVIVCSLSTATAMN